MIMKKEKADIQTTPNGLPPAASYDDGNIPKEDLPQDEIHEKSTCKAKTNGESV